MTSAMMTKASGFVKSDAGAIVTIVFWILVLIILGFVIWKFFLKR